ncbi:MAG: flagellar motor protein MotB [Sulfurospirillaceae bacterium]|nr:flagellar motor protein MotB [Sulfurospirillaceae bacterium]MDD3462864.1 flagellar motor protein MotB [Sulfurospirillaceae bacterium]
MAKQKPCNCPKCMPQWLAAFGDLMSLLLCFFVLLLSMSSMDAKKVQEAIGSLAGALSVLEGGTKTEISREKNQQISPAIKQSQSMDSAKMAVQKSVVEVNEMLKTSGAPEVLVEEAEDGFIIRLPSGLLFKEGSAMIDSEDAFLFLKRISLIVAKLSERLNINVKGHTDNQQPDSNSLFRDNWELSTARGVSVAKELMKNGVNPARIIASGRAEYEPIASNATDEGRAKNRRVELTFFSLDKGTKKEAQQSVLDAQTSVQE